MSLFSDSVDVAEKDLEVLREEIKDTERIAEELLQLIEKLEDTGDYRTAKEKVERAIENCEETGRNTRKIRRELDELEG